MDTILTPPKKILIVSGFRPDTYCEIEKSFVELSVKSNEEISYYWLVPDHNNKDLRFKDSSNRLNFVLPLYVKALIESDANIITGNITKYNIIRNFIIFYKVFRAYDFDAVYTHFGFERFYATLFAKLFRKKTIWNEHWYSLSTKFIFFKKVFYLLFVDCFVAVSKFIADTLPFQNKKIFWILNSVPLNKRGQIYSKSRLNSMLNNTHNFIILMVAAYRKEKRYDLAIDIAKRIVDKYNDVTFVFLGDGELRKLYNKKIEEMGLKNNIFAPGHVHNVQDYYKISDIVILTTINEGCGYALLEAMDNSKPVIIFDSGGPKEFIKNGINGILVPENDTEAFSHEIIKLKNDPAKMKLLGENAKNDIDMKYNRDIWLKKLNRILLLALE